MPCLLFKRRGKDRADEKKAKAATKTATKTASTKKGKRNSPAVEEASSVEEEAQESSSESGSSRGETEEQSNKRKNRLTTSRLLKLVSHLKCPSLEAPRRPRRILCQKTPAAMKTTNKVETSDLHDCRALVFELFGRALHINCQQLSIFSMA